MPQQDDAASTPDEASVRLIRPPRHGDARGWFSEVYNLDHFARLGIHSRFVQDNHSFSAAPFTLRGLHLQIAPRAQDKLVRCVRGRIWDVAVDIRRGSPTYARWTGAELSAAGGEQIFVPAGFAHGFVTLEPDCEVVYKVSEGYSPECERGFRWDDADAAIAWPLPAGAAPVLSAKDQLLPPLSALDSPFAYDGRPLEPLTLA